MKIKFCTETFSVDSQYKILSTSLQRSGYGAQGWTDMNSNTLQLFDETHAKNAQRWITWSENREICSTVFLRKLLRITITKNLQCIYNARNKKCDYYLIHDHVHTSWHTNLLNFMFGYRFTLSK